MANGPHGINVLSAAPAEHVVMRHGDNNDHLEARRADGSWQSAATAADYMPAGAARRYLRNVGEVYRQCRRRNGDPWKSGYAPDGCGLQLYLIDGRFEALSDEQ